MYISFIFTLFLLTATVMTKSDKQWITLEARAEHEEGIRWGNRASPELQHECIFHVKDSEASLKILQEHLEKSSDPTSNMYGKHLRKDEVDRIMSNEADMEIVKRYITDAGATVVKETRNAITATAPISVWAHALNTEFFRVEGNYFDPIIRAHKYSLPADVAEHVSMVLNTAQLPVRMSRGPVISGPIGRLPVADQKY